MLPVSDVSQNGQNNAPSTSQSQVIASVVAQQKVIASQRNASSGDAGNQDLTGQHRRDKLMRGNEAAAQRKLDMQRAADDKADEKISEAKAADARSVIEAQEASAADAKVTAAYIGRHSFTELLSVIRDPEDRVLPKEPANLGA